MKSFLIIFVAFLCLVLTPHTRAETIAPIELFLDQNVSSDPAGVSHPGGNQVMRTSAVLINPAFIEAMKGLEHGHNFSALKVRVSFFLEPPMIVTFNRWERISPVSSALIGSIQGIPGSEAIFVTDGSTLTVNISLPGKRFHIRPVNNGVHEVQDVDSKRFPEHMEPIPISLSPVPYPFDPPIVYDSTQIDVLVAYTADARAAAGGTAAIESLIDLAVAETNQGYINSAVTQRIRLVHKVETSYSETGFDWNLTLDRLQGTSDGYMDNIHTLRNTYQADMVVLIVNDQQWCGLGYLMQTLSPSFADYAFCLVSRVCATGYYSFAHEMGHNMGAHHDRANAGSYPGVYSYSYGYQAPDYAFRTIMAYNCTGGCPRINYWSNPDVSYNGQPTGVLYTAPTSADNRRTLNNTVATVANFRQSGIYVTVHRTGMGTITSSPAGIDCGDTCSSAFSKDTMVTLSASADPGYVFAGWSGSGCAGTGTCEVTMNDDKEVFATFYVQPEPSLNEGAIGTQLTINGAGFGDRKGKVLINGIPAKIAKYGWTDSQITCTIAKPPLPADTAHQVTVVSRTASLLLNDTFTLRSPALDDLADISGTYPEEITITGKFFGTKKGKVYLYDQVNDKRKACKVTYWYMNPLTGESELRFLAPKPSKGFPVGPYPLEVVNKVSVTEKINFTIEPLP